MQHFKYVLHNELQFSSWHEQLKTNLSQKKKEYEQMQQDTDDPPN